MKKNSLVLLVSIVALGAAAYWYMARAPESGSAAKGIPPVPVLLAKAKVQDMPVFLDVVGRAEAYESVTVGGRASYQRRVHRGTTRPAGR